MSTWAYSDTQPERDGEGENYQDIGEDRQHRYHHSVFLGGNIRKDTLL